jgi:hypothetical protein
MLCKYPKEKKADSARTWKTRRNMAKTNWWEEKEKLILEMSIGPRYSSKAQNLTK